MHLKENYAAARILAPLDFFGHAYVKAEDSAGEITFLSQFHG